MSDTASRLSAAKLWLISQPTVSGSDAPRDLPYLAHAMYALRVVETTAVAGLSADVHWRLYANPLWVTDTHIAELGRELAHLVWHLLMDHAGRAHSMHVDVTTAEHWHQAAELTIHETLEPVGASPKPTSDEAEDGTIPRTGRADRNQPAEQYYASFSGLPAILPEQGPEQPTDQGCRCGSCCDGLTRTSDMPADTDADIIGRVEADVIRKQVAIDYQEHAAKGRGTTPGEALRWARNLTHPTIPWEPLLARAVRRGIGWTTGRTEPTWTRPSRRQTVTPNILQPGWRRPIPHIAMVIDTSGTVDDQLLGRAMAEVDGAIGALGIPGACVTVLACDAAVGAVTRVRKAADVTLIGGGGTDMRVGITAASQQRPRPDLIVVLTDGYTPWPAAPPAGSAVIGAPCSDAPAKASRAPHPGSPGSTVYCQNNGPRGSFSFGSWLGPLAVTFPYSGAPVALLLRGSVKAFAKDFAPRSILLTAFLVSYHESSSFVEGPLALALAWGTYLSGSGLVGLAQLARRSVKT